jgi:ATP-dependent RNA helicase DeaD
MRFEELNIRPELIRKARESGFESLTEIQEKTISLIVKGRDVVGQAETGSGKTLAFGLPILSRIRPRGGLQVLILTPTRELCVQVTDVFSDFGKVMGTKAISVYGGVGIEPQIRDIKTADIVVGTPGRILDHLSRNTINFGEVRFLVLDETDRMLDMGFIDDVERIIRHVPRDRQTLMFSATISFEIEDIMKRHLKDPAIIRTQSYVDTGKLKQFYYDIHYQRDKFPLLVHLLKNATPGLCIVFCATKDETALVAKNLRRQGINAMEIHGGMSQNLREKSLESLKNEKINVLVATDVAARGLDIKNVTHIYNYDVPNTGKEYIHRIGRTARAGERGTAVTLLTNRDHDNFRRINREEEVDIVETEMPHFKRVPFIRERPPMRSSPFGRGPQRPRHGSGRPRSGSRYRSRRRY